MKYDKTLFAGTAGYYEQYRPRYVGRVFEEIVRIFEPNREDVLLDLGCGTGEVGLPLSKHFDKVVAWDPSAEMLALARQKACEEGIENVVFEQKSSDDLPSLQDKIKLCTMGQSFHWMDGMNTLAEIKKHLVPGGGVAILGVRHGLHIYSADFDEPNELTAERNWVVREIGKKYLGAERKAGHGVFAKNTQSFEDMLGEAGFSEINELVFYDTVRRTIDDVVGFLFSSSWGNRGQLGEKADDFERELRDALLELKSDGVFEERVAFWLLTARVKFMES